MRIAAISKALALMLSIGGGMTLIVLKPVTAETQAPPSLAQVVALDECDPATFNAALGPGFCLNVTPFGSAVPLPALLASVAAGTPNPNWDFEPDSLTIPKQDYPRSCEPGRGASHVHGGGAVRRWIRTSCQPARRERGA